MKDLLGHESIVYPLKFLGLTSPFFGVNTHTILFTWLTILVILLLCLTGKNLIIANNSVGSYIVKGICRNFIDLITESFGKLIDKYYYFIGSLFLFILISNWIAIIPYVEEPTKDINTTLALGIFSFFYIQKEKIKIHGIIAFIKEFLMPLQIMFPFNLIVGLALLPLKLLGEFASVISISFRLFGNIFGGSILISLAQQAISGSILLHILTIGLNFILIGFFILFEGYLQAFVFSILSLTNLVMAIQEHEGKE